ncbi:MULTISPECIES: molybdopterin cofactor-binding domain-containing protein [unclassified Rhizobium]|uniref:xanthine dehydrogenase family protein molybdopterin-binding subunit n=1 Tax=unclassified Rhizobium TaxID=2613769 RepID=UPI00084BFFFB|nr:MULTISPECIES: molybdopterin cofactor-binding domain-containing protein [unclassified Rhizobium]OEC93864.1 aldehyde dehydrogenase [Rhizobium sp. YK2]QYA15967.1 xanthine dehydrogenase family protein molybdopterin-binding subunit [Rhizobium sp. AB2/73]UEQ84510.1 xanthine dehydrogenase family protein molybdopterin-binding subunit [Rhizobium sp. AB2/73]
MNSLPASGITRRSFLTTSGIAVAFALTRPAFAQLAGGGEGGAGPAIVAPNLPGSLKSWPYLDSWIQLDSSGHATVFTGKAELGQGIRTALLQVAAEELDLGPDAVTLVTVDTARTPDEGLTAGSHSMQDSGTAIRNAAANVRMLLIGHAAQRFENVAEQLTTTGDGHVLAPDGRRLGYGEIAGELSLHVEAIANAPLRQKKEFRTMGTSLARVDIPAKISGGQAFIHDIRLPGMLHARVVRGPSERTRLKLPSAAEIETMPRLFKFVQNGDFAAVVAEREWDAVKLMRRLQASAYELSGATFPTGKVEDVLKSLPAREISILDVAGRPGSAIKTRSARYTRRWISHGSIGPSCALAWLQGDLLTIWTHSQGTYDVRRVAAELLDYPIEKIRAIHAEGAGCYGQNGADDVAAEAAFIAMKVPGKPVRLQWMREQEFGWEPLGPGMATEVEAGLDADNNIIAWKYDVWSNPHNNRPVGAGGVLIGNEVTARFQPPEGRPIPMPEGDGSRNSNPLYDLPNMKVVYHFIKDMPIRVSALRSLGAHLNVFSIESMFDELALVGGIDPLDLRMKHMADQRARRVMQTATEAFGWRGRQKRGPFHGFGMAFARYKNLGAYCAICLEVSVDQNTGRITVHRAQAATDCGEIVSPNGVQNQVEGAIIQSLSWCTREAVTNDETIRTSFDWSTYPILRFLDIPEKIDVIVENQPGQPFLGVAECGQGPASAALANALADATGIRFRDMPLTPEKVRAAIITQ